MTIKGYDMRRRMYTLDYPNDEVRRGFVSLMANSYFHTKEVDNENWIIQIDDMLRDFSYTFYIFQTYTPLILMALFYLLCFGFLVRRNIFPAF